MSEAEVNLSVAILEDHFGPIVATIGETLLAGSLSLPILCHRVHAKIKSSEVKRALVILEQHNLMEFNLDERQHLIYSIKACDIIRLMRSARCSLVAKTLYGEIAEAVCEEIIAQGRLTCSECIRRVAARLEETFKEIKVVFARLVESQMLIRCSQVESNFFGCPIFKKTLDPFIMPNLILDAKDDASVGNDKTVPANVRKRNATNMENKDPDAGIHWRLNYAKFERYLRDEMVVAEFEAGDKYHENCSEVLRILLKISELKVDDLASSSFPIPVHDIVRIASTRKSSLERREIETALTLLCDCSGGIVRKVGDSGGGLYVVDFEKAIAKKCQRHVEAAIREKCSPGAVRIFRLLLEKKYLEEDHIEKLAMLSTVETRECCSQLVDNKFASHKCIPKTNDFAPARTIYLYYADLPVVADNFYQFNCKILRNLMVRRKHETKEHKTLTDRQLKMETIVANIEADESLDENTKKQQISEVEEIYITAADRLQLERYRASQITLLSIEIQVDYDILLLRWYIHYGL